MPRLLAQHFLCLVDQSSAELLGHLLLLGEFGVLRLECAGAFLGDS